MAATQLIPASPLGAAEQSPFQTRLLFSSFLVILGSLTSQGSGHCNKGGERQWFPEHLALESCEFHTASSSAQVSGEKAEK